MRRIIKNKLPLFFIIGVVFLSCWERQDHEIMIPKTPIYNLSGRVICSLTHKPLAQVDIILSGLVKYNEEEESRILVLSQTTDENGMFFFSEVPGGYGYFFTAKKEGWKTENLRYVLPYRDYQVEDVILGKLLVEEKYCYYNGIITGIACENRSIWIADTLNRKMVEFDENLNMVRSAAITLNIPISLAYDGQWFWSSDPFKETVFKFQIDDWGHIRYGESYSTPEDANRPGRSLVFLDIACNSRDVWACSKKIRSKYLKFKPDVPQEVLYFDSPVMNPKGIAIDSTKIFIAYSYSSKNLLYLIDKNTNVALGYYAIPDDAGLIAVNNNLIWIATKDKITKYLF